MDDARVCWFVDGRRVAWRMRMITRLAKFPQKNLVVLPQGFLLFEYTAWVVHLC
jgi:hypothetical protein